MEQKHKQEIVVFTFSENMRNSSNNNSRKIILELCTDKELSISVTQKQISLFDHKIKIAP